MELGCSFGRLCRFHVTCVITFKVLLIDTSLSLSQQPVLWSQYEEGGSLLPPGPLSCGTFSSRSLSRLNLLSWSPGSWSWVLPYSLLSGTGTTLNSTISRSLQVKAAFDLHIPNKPLATIQFWLHWKSKFRVLKRIVELVSGGISEAFFSFWEVHPIFKCSSTFIM